MQRKCIRKHLAKLKTKYNKRMQSDFGKLRLPQPLMRALNSTATR